MLKKIVLDLETHPAFAKATADLFFYRMAYGTGGLYA
jgi:hypothetical protein